MHYLILQALVGLLAILVSMFLWNHKERKRLGAIACSFDDYFFHGKAKEFATKNKGAKKVFSAKDKKKLEEAQERALNRRNEGYQHFIQQGIYISAGAVGLLIHSNIAGDRVLSIAVAFFIFTMTALVSYYFFNSWHASLFLRNKSIKERFLRMPILGKSYENNSKEKIAEFRNDYRISKKSWRKYRNHRILVSFIYLIRNSLVLFSYISFVIAMLSLLAFYIL